jgi:hypothetical protein
MENFSGSKTTAGEHYDWKEDYDMTKINDGGPAFPTRNHEHSTGMSLRDYFAGLIAGGDAAEGGWSNDLASVNEYAVKRAAVYYAIADAMIVARERNP